jgi:hypothetical protein
MAWQELRRMRRRTRQAMRIREWPWRRKVALGAWVPVGIVAFLLFTGPNGSPSGAEVTATTKPPTVTTVKLPPPKASVKQIADGLRVFKQRQADVKHWVNATPVRLTPQQQFDMLRWFGARKRLLVQQHKAAEKTTHHRSQMTP